MLLVATQASSAEPPEGSGSAARKRTAGPCEAYTVGWNAKEGLRASPGFPADVADRLRELYEGGHASRVAFVESQGGAASVESRLKSGDESLRRSVWALDRGLRLRDEARRNGILREVSRRCRAESNPGGADIADEADEAMRQLLLQEADPSPFAVHRGEAPMRPK